jgi:hypothetical protein
MQTTAIRETKPAAVSEFHTAFIAACEKIGCTASARASHEGRHTLINAATPACE